MKQKVNVLNLILILVLCLSFITPMVLPTQVLAAEEEEEDNFTTMPNYRWKNETTTNVNVSEYLVGDQYYINNTNEMGSGTQQLFAKSRPLNSRDFYFESRFALDIGGEVVGDSWDWEENNSNEYWHNEGNVSDFEDGSIEAWDNDAPMGFTYTNEDGWLKVTRTGNTINTQLERAISSIPTSYKYMVMEIIPTSGTAIDKIEIWDSQGQLNAIDETNIANGTNYLFSETLANWGGSETDIKFLIRYTDTHSEPTFYVNFVYLFDEAMVEEEGYTRRSGATLDFYYNNPLDYVSVAPDTDSNYMNYHAIGLSIDSDKYTRASVSIKASHDDLRFAFYDGTNTLTDYQTITTEFLTYTFTLDADWSGTETAFGLSLAENSGQGNFDGDESFTINTIALYGSYSTTDGFKFSLLNADDIEGMAFQFTRNVDLSYDISIDMFNSGGTALDYDYSFDYDIDVDGWLLLRVDWNLDKRESRIVLKFENGTRILRVSRITDLYGGNIGFAELYLLEDGFPSLCINNSIGAIARSHVVISYIDADWKIIDWRDPDYYWTFTPAHTSYQHAETSFDSISPYGVTIYEQSVSDLDHWYMLDIDRFDGLSFDWKTDQENLDSGDYSNFYMGVYNVGRDGSLEALFRFRVRLTYTNILYAYHVKGAELIERTSTETEAQGSISVYYDSDTKIIMDTKFSDVNDDFQATIEVNPAGENFTKEMLFVFAYEVDTSAQGSANDIIEFSIGGFEITRKDILGFIVGAILGPFFQLMGVLFSPFIFIFSLLTVAILKGFKDLLLGLEPFFDILGVVFETAISSLESTLSGIFEGLGDAFGDAIGVLWDILFGVASLFADFIEDVLDFLIPLLISMAELIWSFLAGVVFWIWAELGLPDLLAILGLVLTLVFNVINAVPEMLQAIIDLFLFWHLWILIGIWIIILPMQAAQCEGISDFFERILGILCIDCVPFEVWGFGGWFPIAIPLIFWTCAEIIGLA